jgi:membrane-associated protease RseP (regulator of RpoE activity)
MRNRILTAMFLAALGGGVAAAGPIAKAPAHPSAPIHAMSKARLGFAALPISSALRAHFGAPEDRGVLVDRVVPDSPAERAGLQVGDVVTEVDGDAATSARDVIEALSDRKKGDEVTIAAIRDGKHVELHATLETDPAVADSFSTIPDSGDDDIRQMFDQIRRQMREMEQHAQPPARHGDKI